MAGANKRTTCALATTAVIFIIVIIILCLVPDPCYRNDPRPECQHPKHFPVVGDITTSTHPPTPTSSSSAASTSPSTSSSSTTERLPVGDSSTTAFSTHISESSLFTDDGSTTTLASDITDTTKIIETLENGTTGLTNATTEFQDGTTTEMYHEITTIDNVSTTLELDKTVNETSTSTASDEANATEVYTTATSEDTIAADMSTTETVETENRTDVTTTETTETGNETEISITETTATENDTLISTTETAETEKETEISTTESVETEKVTEVSDTTTVSTTDVYTKLKITVVSGEICNTSVCKEVSRRMLDIMDPNDVDPCEDFYQYSCGGILDDPFLKPEKPQVYADKIIKDALIYGDKEDEELKELFVMYDSCTNYSSVNKTHRISLAREVFEELGYQFNPMANDYYKKEHPTDPVNFDLGKALAKMMKRHFTPFFDIIMDVSKDDKSKFSLKMVLPLFQSPFTKDRAKDACFGGFKRKTEEAKMEEKAFDVNLHYEEYVNCTKLGRGLQVRMEHIEDSINDLGLLDFIENSTIREQIKSQSRQELDFMLGDFAKETPSIPEMRKTILSKAYEEFALSDFDKGDVFGELPFKMKDVIETLLGHPISNPEDFKIQVYFKDVFKELFRVIYDMYDGQEPLMQNIVMLMWMEHIYDDLISPLGPPPGSPDYCFSAVTNLMDDYVSLLYLKESPEHLEDQSLLYLKESPEHLEDQMKHMIDLTLDLMKSQVGNSGMETRQDFMQKLVTMTGEVASVEASRKALQRNKDNLMINITANDFTGNYMNLMQTYRKRLYSSLENPASEESTLWSFLQFPYRNTGVASYGLNKFLIPHGAMLPPYFYNGAPDYINYAGIGHMISHELLHGFDSTGMKYNGASISEMKNDPALIGASECVATKLENRFHMNSSTDIQYSFQLDKYLNLNELLVDMAATNLAWDAYINDLRNQRTKSLTSATVSPRSRTAETLSGAGEATTTLYDLALIHWEDKRILQSYFIKTAQNQCSSTSELDIIDVMENEHLPPKLRVNLGIQNNKLFKEAFNCPSDPQDNVCYFSPMGHN